MKHTEDSQPKPKKLGKNARLNEMLEQFEKACPLTSWASYVEGLHVPEDILPAVMTGRPELLRLAPPRPLTQEECAVLYKLIAGLIETNAVLRIHAEQVSQLVENWMGGFLGIHRIAVQIEQFAKFRKIGAPEEEEE